MSFRRRVVVFAAAAVSVSVVLGSVATYVIVRGDLSSGVDRQLRSLAAGVSLKSSPTGAAPGAVPSAAEARVRSPRAGSSSRDHRSGPRLAVGVNTALGNSQGFGPSGGWQLALPASAVEPAGYAQYVTRGGQVVLAENLGSRRLAVTRRTRAVAAGDAAAFFADATVDGLPLRILTVPAPSSPAGIPGGAVQAAVSLQSMDETLSSLRWALTVVSLVGIGLAAVLGVLVARAATSPLAALSRMAERVSVTRDLSERIGVRGEDELGRLASSFNRMLGALEASSHAQRQLVADASHELRTPLASLLMNVELLAEGAVAHEDRERLVDDVVGQIRELTVLVGDLVDLARDEDPPETASEEVRLDELVSYAVARARRHAPAQRIELRTEPCLVSGVHTRLERAVNNLLDNAVKWNPAGERIEIAVNDDALISVRDHGPGFAPHDLGHVFDRFYRASGARGLPGAGLGLAIVRQVAEAHGGSVAAANAPGGGALVWLQLPAVFPLSFPILDGSSPAPGSI